LHHLNLWTGERHFSIELEDRPAPGQAPIATHGAIIVPFVDSLGIGARAYDRQTGEQLWKQAPGFTTPTSAWLPIDNAVVVNSDAGVLLCIEAETGRFRFNHVFSRSVDADQPRRLAPVLRNGALFVPPHEVHVVRPRDGEILGTVPTDLIPDLLRVDERCDVYVAEESGHLAAFGAAAKLALVR
jgi:hypothetical protein